MAHFTTSDGVRIYYESHGTGDPLLLAYGIGGNAGMWQPNVHALLAGTGSCSGSPAGTPGRRARPTPPGSPSATGCSTSTTCWITSGSTHAVVGGLSLGGRHRHPVRPRPPRAGAGPGGGGLVLRGRGCRCRWRTW